MKEIPLTQGFVALVDDEDFECASDNRWYACRIGHTVYARRNARLADGTRRVEYLHRVLVPGAGLVDHRDGNGLNNTRANLRAATKANNSHNSGPQRNNTSGYRGVSRHSATGKWQVHIRVSGRRHYLGTYADPVEAARAYDAAARAHFGEFARPNFPEEG